VNFTNPAMAAKNVYGPNDDGDDDDDGSGNGDDDGGGNKDGR